MRIVVFGPGRVGNSFVAFAESLGHQTTVIDRSEAGAVAAVAAADVIAAAIPDDSLGPWFERWREALSGKRAVHFSGARLIPGLPGYHPLYSFPTAPLPPAVFGTIAIAREQGAAPFADILPGALNPEFVVRDEDRAFYHALAVVSGNYSAHLWNQAAAAFAARIDPNAGAILGAYFDSIVARFRESPFASMTGPIARRDRTTVEANLEALDRDPSLKGLYRAFLESAWPESGGKPPDRG